MTSNDLAPAKTEQTLEQLIDIAALCAPKQLKGLTEPQKVLRIARAHVEMIKVMDSDKGFRALLGSLCNSQIGFGSDKKYDDKVLLEAAMVALMIGARLTSFAGHEWMILSGKCYLCKPFYQRVLAELHGVTDVVVQTEAVEQNETNTAYVPVVVKLRDNGKLRTWAFRKTKEGNEQVDRRIAVRVNAGMIIDGILGKAEAKALRRVYTELTGEDIPEDDHTGIQQEFAADGNPK